MIENIKQEYEKIKGDITADKYINDFKKAFKTIQDERVNTNLLKELYDEFVIYTFRQTKPEKFIIGELADLEEDLTKKFDDIQKQQLKVYDYLLSELADIQSLTSFIYGYCIANELNMSANSYAINNNILSEMIQKYKLANNKGGDVDNG